ncbi:MAG: FadR/GntR family transcriptional regulator [Acidimicrobiales bacterium]
MPDSPAPTTKAGELAARIREMILVEGLEPGDPLPSETELMAAHQLSRATVRETLRILDAEGFVKVRIGRTGGVVVAHPDPDRLGSWLAAQLTLRAATVESLVEFRRLVEPIAAAVAAERATPEELRRLRDVLESATAEEELDFHLYIADATHNELLRLLLRAVHTGLQQHAVYRQGATERDAQAGRRQHRRIFEAISDRDSERAADLMRRHLEGVEKVVRRTGRAHEVLVPPEAWRTT